MDVDGKLWISVGKLVKVGDNLRSGATKPRPLYYMYYVYVIQWEKDKTFYVGYTKDLKQRAEQHAREGSLKLIYYEAYFIKEVSKK